MAIISSGSSCDSSWDSYTDPNSVRIGVNWGYTSSQLESQLEPELMVAIAAFLLLVIFTGYLIIYNIFQISVAGDIRFYGLLKTIGTTPRQLKRIIRQQALLLCLIGIPAGHCANGFQKSVKPDIPCNRDLKNVIDDKIPRENHQQQKSCYGNYQLWIELRLQLGQLY